MAKTVDEYLQAHSEWSEHLSTFRKILIASGLTETVKWGAPTYTLDGKNLVGMGAFKAYAGLWFMDGALMKDPDGVLINAQEGRTRGMRQWRFQQDDPIDEARIQAYVEETMANARAGKTIKPQSKGELVIPEILARALSQDDKLKSAFDDFIPSKQREFAEYINDAKREATREKRLEKIRPMIARGEGLNDRYRNC